MDQNKNKGIKEIARLAGVSIGTVDRVLHNRGRVAIETRKRVEKIARKINYRPNLMARSLATNAKTTIAMLIPDPKGDEFWKQAYGGIEELKSKYEQHGLRFEPYFYSLDRKSSFSEQAEKILNKAPDGVILAPNFLNESRIFFNQCQVSSIPVVMFDTAIPDCKPICFIGTDSFLSGQVAAELLSMTSWRNGKFAILHFDEELNNSPHMLEKERGFLSYLRADCPEKEFLVLVLNNKKHHYTAQLKKLFEEEIISGIFVSTSKTYRIGSFLKREKINDIILVGYDLTTRNKTLLKNGVISFLINQNPRRQAAESVNTFYNHFILRETVKPRLSFPIEIIVRTSLESIQGSVSDH